MTALIAAAGCNIAALLLTKLGRAGKAELQNQAPACVEALEQRLVRQRYFFPAHSARQLQSRHSSFGGLFWANSASLAPNFFWHYCPPRNLGFSSRLAAKDAPETRFRVRHPCRPCVWAPGRTANPRRIAAPTRCGGISPNCRPSYRTPAAIGFRRFIPYGGATRRGYSCSGRRQRGDERQRHDARQPAIGP